MKLRSTGRNVNANSKNSKPRLVWTKLVRQTISSLLCPFTSECLTVTFFLQHMGSREDVSARIEADTKLRINEMNKAVQMHKEQVSNFISLFKVL